MNKLSFSPRIDLLAELAEGRRAADVGTDHAFVPILLLQNRGFEKVIASDIHPGPLEKAKINLAAYGIPAEKAELRLGSGLDVLQQGEADSLILAGMGGELMAQILEKEPQKSRSFRKILLQPRTKEAFLRKWLLRNGYSIEEERLVQEKDRICQILCVRSGAPCRELSDFDAAYPDAWFSVSENRPLAQKLAENETERLELLLQRLERSSDEISAADKKKQAAQFLAKLRQKCYSAF